jgi:predicted glycoside hydrolase/deacetylase ChbG (UPF0249 family)
MGDRAFPLVTSIILMHRADETCGSKASSIAVWETEGCAIGNRIDFLDLSCYFQSTIRRVLEGFMKQKWMFISALVFAVGLAADSVQARTKGGEVVLLVRADDIGSSHAANAACIDSYRNGIARSVDIMVPCPWFPEAVRMLAENQGLDVGVHLTLTSEWENMKWGPLTCAPSLVDPDGYFFPMVWENKEFPPKCSLKEAAWDILQVERELRAQIELALKYIPRISHVSGHMAFERMHPALDSLVRKLEKEYGLEAAFPEGMKGFRGFGQGKTAKEKIRNFVNALEALEPGIYMLVDHPGEDGPEMRAIGHKGYYGVAAERGDVTRLFTDKKVLKTVREKGIKLVSYRDLKELPAHE